MHLSQAQGITFINLCKEISKNSPFCYEFLCSIFNLKEIIMLKNAILKNEYLTKGYLYLHVEKTHEDYLKCDEIRNEILLHLKENKIRQNALYANTLFKQNINTRFRQNVSIPKIRQNELKIRYFQNQKLS